MKLHIGCGTVYLKDFVNIDGAPHYIIPNCPNHILEQNITTFEKYYKQEFGTLSGYVVADIKHDINKPLPFDNKSVEKIVMYQVLEHIPLYEVDGILIDFFRILQDDGSIYLSVPDIKETAKLLTNAKTNEEEDWVIRLIHGTQRNKWSHHYCGYTIRTLTKLLNFHGFSNIEELSNINIYPTIHLKVSK